ncbi:DUF2203 domain-containing protein [Effusibacillus lacus]|uniref:Cell division protein DivIVA n=1 Tax=Effusibacillus lacus TaxID=1348429 RepID=A0A292YLY4_9BACL|nr:DUF2203 domain-containing protein [Effusibacillus lacus]TCS71391.1 hypothetical protein EDD64_1269 [Effusibacillus lacus]GAX89921.1 hypothetical protein EFBL_1547 [Effusibacillus lacus]
MKRYFTVEEANRQLPLIEPLLLNLQNLKQEITRKNQELQTAKSLFVGLAAPDAFFAEEAGIEFLVMHANSLIAKVQEYGAEIKNVDLGLIDFYTIMDGQEACLCWKLGEPHKIQYWHGLHEGFLGRKPITRMDNPH